MEEESVRRFPAVSVGRGANGFPHHSVVVGSQLAVVVTQVVQLVAQPLHFVAQRLHLLAADIIIAVRFIAQR